MARVQSADEEEEVPLVAVAAAARVGSVEVDDEDDVENQVFLNGSSRKQQRLEPMALGAMLDEVKVFMLNQAESEEKYELLSSTVRPSEPDLNLDYVRERELDAMMKEGEASAEMAALDAGFFGGNSKAMIALFLFFGTAFSGVSLGWYIQFVNFREGRRSRERCDSLWKTVLYMLYYASLSFGFYGRAYFLIQGDSINALVAIGRGATCASLLLMSIALVYGARETRFRCSESQRRGTSWFSGIAVVNSVTIAAHIFVTGRMLTLRLTKRASAQFGLLRLHLIFYFAFLSTQTAVQFKNDSYILWLAVTLLIVVVELWFRRQRFLHLAHVDAIVREDISKYDHVWDGVKHQPWLQKIAEQLERCVRPRDCERPVVAVVRRELCDHNNVKQRSTEVVSGDDVMKPAQAVKDLGVLFAQAARLNDVFQEVVAGWAPPEAASSYHVHTPCHVKRRKRAIEKLFRSYGGDATRLTDLVRSSITCDTPDDLLKCLNSIFEDPRVAVLAFKNRFSTDYDSSRSLGYRNLALNLVLVTDFTMRHRVDNHICELQLGVKDFDHLKNDAGHRRYVEWRDKSAE